MRGTERLSFRSSPGPTTLRPSRRDDLVLGLTGEKISGRSHTAQDPNAKPVAGLRCAAGEQAAKRYNFRDARPGMPTYNRSNRHEVEECPDRTLIPTSGFLQHRATTPSRILPSLNLRPKLSPCSSAGPSRARPSSSKGPIGTSRRADGATLAADTIRYTFTVGDNLTLVTRRRSRLPPPSAAIRLALRATEAERTGGEPAPL